jgi:hypothetical protein
MLAPLISSKYPSICFKTLLLLASSGSGVISREIARARASISLCLFSSFSRCIRAIREAVARLAMSGAVSRVIVGAFVAGSNMSGKSPFFGRLSSDDFVLAMRFALW